jgi:hypothetical protein
MSRVIAAILLVAVLVLGGGIIATTAYNAGVTAGAVSDGAGTTATPVVVPAYGYGWHAFGWGWGFFGFLFFLFLLFIVFALLRAIFWRGGPRRGWGPGYWGGSGGSYGSWSGPDKGPNGHGGWEGRAHDTFDDWHRKAHGQGPGEAAGAPESPGPGEPPTSTGVA